MATTTNYGWTTPDDTSLVKDGASAIRTLGSSIDTSLNNALGTKKAGLVLLNTTSFSAVASQSVNDVFSTTYDNYKIILYFSSSLDETIFYKLRVGGTDNTTTNYHGHISFLNSTVNTYSGLGYATQGAFRITSSNGTNSVKGVELNVFNPFKTENTLINGLHTLSSASGAGLYSGGALQGGFSATTSFTGFTINPGTGTISGNVSVFGVNS